MNAESPARALVAEDDRALADIIRMALSRAQFQVTVAHDGRKALQLAEASRFDVIVSDFQMPRLDGQQLLSGVRAGGASQEALLILCSAKSYELDTEALREQLKLAAVFFKPFSLGELVATITSARAATTSPTT